MCLCSLFLDTQHSPSTLQPETQRHRKQDSNGNSCRVQWEMVPLVQRGGRQDRERWYLRGAAAFQESCFRTQPLNILQWNYCGDWLPSLKMPASVQNTIPRESRVAFFKIISTLWALKWNKWINWKDCSVHVVGCRSTQLWVVFFFSWYIVNFWCL